VPGRYLKYEKMGSKKDCFEGSNPTGKVKTWKKLNAVKGKESIKEQKCEWSLQSTSKKGNKGK